MTKEVCRFETELWFFAFITDLLIYKLLTINGSDKIFVTHNLVEKIGSLRAKV